MLPQTRKRVHLPECHFGEKKNLFLFCFFFPLKNSQTVLRAVKYRETQFPGKGVPTLDSLPNTPGDLFVSVRSQFTPGNINKDISVLWVCVGGWLVFFIYFFYILIFLFFSKKGCPISSLILEV